MAAISLGPEVVPDAEQQGFSLGGRTARQLRTLASVYPPPPGWGDLTTYLDLTVTPQADVAATAPCRGRVRPSTQTVRPNGRPVVTAPEGRAVTVLVGRFGRKPAKVAEVPAGRAVTLELDGVESLAPWVVTAAGGCVTPG